MSETQLNEGTLKAPDSFQLGDDTFCTIGSSAECVRCGRATAPGRHLDVGAADARGVAGHVGQRIVTPGPSGAAAGVAVVGRVVPQVLLLPQSPHVWLQIHAANHRPAVHAV